MKALVTGGTGYVGGAIARALKARGEAVRVLARPTSRVDHLRRDGIEIAIGDVLDEASVAAALEDCTTLYHAAAIWEMWVPDPRVMMQTAIDGTRHVMNAARRLAIPRIVYTSSTRTIGERQGEIGREDTVHEGVFQTTYDESKFRAEQVVLDLARQGLPVVIVNPSGVFGPGGVGATSEAVLKTLNDRVPVILPGIVSLCYVDDVAEGHLLAAERGRAGDRYILSAVSIDVADWARQACALAGVKPPTVVPMSLARAGTWLGEPLTRVLGIKPVVSADTVRMLSHGSTMDGSKAARDLGVRYTPFETGLRRALAWYWEQGLLRTRPRFLPAA
jgi:dihydroflavonol-4-reductase